MVAPKTYKHERTAKEHMKARVNIRPVHGFSIGKGDVKLPNTPTGAR